MTFKLYTMLVLLPGAGSKIFTYTWLCKILKFGSIKVNKTETVESISPNVIFFCAKFELVSSLSFIVHKMCLSYNSVLYT